MTDDTGADRDSVKRMADHLREARALIRRIPLCPECDELRRINTLPGDGPCVVERIHAPHCSQHEDNQEADAVHIGPGFDMETFRAAEHIWSTPDNGFPQA